VAKYFAIIPAIAVFLYSKGNSLGPLSALNVMHLGSPESAILSAVIFNAIIIVLLIPLALKGVNYTPMSANKALIKNLFVYGLGGVVAPFAGIKLIDLVINLFA
jgi:K+-transporting ATPase ATPase B chain